MPDRIVRAGIISSDKVNQLSWPAEVFYRRLFSVADDYGRYDANPSILRAYLFPLRLDKVGEPDIVKWMTECSKAGLVRCYTVNGKEYLEIINFNQRVRASKSKYPAPPCETVEKSNPELVSQTSADNCQQVLSNASYSYSNSNSYSEAYSEQSPPPENGTDRIYLLPEMLNVFKKVRKTYVHDKTNDYPALRKISETISDAFNLKIQSIDPPKESIPKLLIVWEGMAKQTLEDKFLSDKSLKVISTQTNSLIENFLKKQANAKPKQPTPIDENVQYILEKAKKRRERQFANPSGDIGQCSTE